jgi:hypothetical protein
MSNEKVREKNMKTKSFTGLLLVLLMLLFLPAIEAAQQEVPGVGPGAEGADLAITNLDGNPRPEMLLMAYGNFEKTSTFRYKIGWNLNANGEAAGWGNFIEVPGISEKSQGAGLAITQLDNNAGPEMILMVYENPAQENSFRYKIGWNLNHTGEAQSWTGYFQAPGVGWEAEGAGLVITQLDNNQRPDMVLMVYDAPPKEENFFRYKIGWNLDEKGEANRWSSYMETLGISNNGTGAGAAVTQIDSDERPELIFMAHDNVGKQVTFYYKIGWNVNCQGEAANWSHYQAIPGNNPEARGAGTAVFDLDGEKGPDFIYMAYYPADTAGREAYFRYTVVNNQAPLKNIYLEMDRLETVKWPAEQVSRAGTVHSHQGIYAPAGIRLTAEHDQDAIVDLKAGQPYTDAEVHSLLSTHANKNAPTGSIPIHAVFLKAHQAGVSGISSITGKKRSLAVFADSYPTTAAYLRAVVHQTGHTLNLGHIHGESSRGSITPGQGFTIMNPDWSLAPGWNFAWSASALDYFYHIPPSQWQPRDREIVKYIRPVSPSAQPKNLELKIGLEMCNYMLGSLIILYVTLKNTGTEAVEAAQYLEPEFGFVEYLIKVPDGREMVFSPWTHKDHPAPMKKLLPGETIRAAAKIFFGSKGWTFKKPGGYQLQALYMKSLRSRPLSVSILSSINEDLKQAAELFLESKEVGYFLLFEGGDHLVEGKSRLEAVAARYPDTSLSTFANFVLGANLMRDFANFKENRLRPANLQLAARYLETAKIKVYSAHKILYTHLYLAEIYKKRGQPERARKLLKEDLPAVMEWMKGYYSFFEDNNIFLKDLMKK